MKIGNTPSSHTFLAETCMKTCTKTTLFRYTRTNQNTSIYYYLHSHRSIYKHRPLLFLRPGRVYRSFVRALNLVGAGPDSDVPLATLTLGGNGGKVENSSTKRGKGRDFFFGCLPQRFIKQLVLNILIVLFVLDTQIDVFFFQITSIMNR